MNIIQINIMSQINESVAYLYTFIYSYHIFHMILFVRHYHPSALPLFACIH
jgi:hypothetical protein